ncbi:MAG: hypothetical protein BWY87_00013 [Deltaproteobacteria bacterium ADurb.Bin510]|nr:MAG: hypothetical protein BWY87_00013 [Deltaproteobacteria bacterium ADurb.Bin510]
MTTSLTDLLAAMPASCAAIFAERLLGHSAGLPELSAALADRERLKRELAGLDDAERGLLRDLGDLDGYCEWDVATRIYAERLDWLRASLASLGRRGLVFQAGLSQHGALVLLPGVDALLDDAAAPAGLDWPAREVDELVEAVLVLNALRTLNLRCRTEGEPFKKGWQQLDDLLGPEIDGHGLFAELSELNCIGEESGLLRVLPGSASDLAIGGPLRYRIWRLQRSCRAFPGLAQRLLRLLEQGPQRRERLQRGLELHLFQHCRGAAAGEAGRLLELWIAAGLVQADSSR